MYFLFLGLGAFVLSYLGVALIRQWALRRKLLDVPNERSLHTQPTPRGGGLIIVGVTLIGSWLLYPRIDTEVNVTLFLAFSAGAVLIAIISWLDDLYSLPNWVRLCVHVLGALMAILAFGYWQLVKAPLWGSFSLGWLGAPLTFLWVVGLINAYNFMDGIDGIAGGQAVVAGVGWLTVGVLIGHSLISVMGLLLAASSLGFLGHNWPPARIFMGDVGSAFLGYMFAVLPLMIHDEPYLPVIGFLLVWPFVFDASFTFIRRLFKKENVFSAHRSHLYQRLVIAGISHKGVSLIYVGMALVGLVCSVALVQGWRGANIMTIMAITGSGFILWVGTYWRERFTSGSNV